MLTYNTLFFATIIGVFFVLVTAFSKRLYRLWQIAVAYLILCMVFLIMYAGKVMIA